MWVIPVMDIRHGQVVRGVAGERARYRPLETPLAEDARPASVLRGLERHFAPLAIYVADLDAIVDGSPRVEAWRDLAEARVPLLLDAGLGDLHTATERLELARRCQIRDVRWIVGLESIQTSQPRCLAELVECLDARRAIFSLDLRGGTLLTYPGVPWPDDPLSVAEHVWRAGFRALVVLDLAQVGRGQGVVAGDLCRQLRQRYPDLELISGGGVRHRADLERLAACGCDAALVATAIHLGTVTPAERWIDAESDGVDGR
jgi:phosphoribosylformimino-5-aminoimidazole carboxamide ribotide isomerase